MERTLYHYPLCPFSRKARLLLGERRLTHKLVTTRPWADQKMVLRLNHAGTVPILLEGEVAFSHSQVICEYLLEAYPGAELLGTDPFMRAEARRLVAWFDETFFKDVVDAIVFEKTVHRALQGGSPNSTRMRGGLAKLSEHMTYMSFLIEQRSWLTGTELTLGDLAAGAHLSTLDYFGHVPWTAYPLVKEWYMRLKSRPSFQSLLEDRIPAFAPVEEYMDLDF